MLKENIKFSLKEAKIAETKTARASYAKYVAKVAELVSTLLIMKGEVTKVTAFINESLPSLISVNQDVADSTVSDLVESKHPISGGSESSEAPIKEELPSGDAIEGEVINND